MSDTVAWDADTAFAEVSKFLKVDIILNKDYDVYFVDDIVEGHIALNVIRKIPVNFVGIQCVGEGKVRWRDKELISPTTYRGREMYYNEYKNFFYDSRLVQPGNYKYNFRFPLNQNCLTSFEGEHGYIRYKIQFIINRVPFRIYKFKRALTVLNHGDVNINPFYKIPRPLVWNKTTCFCLTTSRLIWLTMRTNYATYVPGQRLKLSLELDNRSKKTVLCYKIKFYTKITFTSKIPLESKCTFKKNIFTWTKKIPEIPHQILDHDFVIPSIPPTTNLSEIISVKYLLQVRAVVSCAIISSLKMEKEIHIGTVPLKPEEVAELDVFASEPKSESPPTELVEPIAEHQLSSIIDEVIVVPIDENQRSNLTWKVFERKKVKGQNEKVNKSKKTRVAHNPVIQVLEYKRDSPENLPLRTKTEIVELEEILQLSSQLLSQPDNILPPAQQGAVPKKRTLPVTPMIHIIDHQQDSPDVEQSGAKQFVTQPENIFQPVAKMGNMPLNPTVQIIEHQQDSPDLEQSTANQFVQQRENILLRGNQEAVAKIRNMPINPMGDIIEYQQDSPDLVQSDRTRDLIELKEILPEQLDDNLTQAEKMLPQATQGDVPKKRTMPLTPTVQIIKHQQDSPDVEQSTVQKFVPQQAKQGAVPKKKNMPIDPMGDVIEYQKASSDFVESVRTRNVIGMEEIVPDPVDDDLARSKNKLHQAEEVLTQMGAILKQTEDLVPPEEGRRRRGSSNKRQKRNVCIVDVEDNQRPEVVVLPPDNQMKPYAYQTTVLKYKPFVDEDSLDNYIFYGFRPYYAVYKLNDD